MTCSSNSLLPPPLFVRENYDLWAAKNRTYMRAQSLKLGGKLKQFSFFTREPNNGSNIGAFKVCMLKLLKLKVGELPRQMS